MKPEEIEKLSFNIIDKEAGSHRFNQNEWSIVRRMIHTSADFEYKDTVSFFNDPVVAGIKAIKAGKNIFTDTQMVRSGIRKKSIEKFGGKVSCLINDKDVAKIAKKEKTTRAKAAVDNAPTALLRLIELIGEKKIKPALILGFPVGFVNAAESKDLLMEQNISHITNKGRKGGSNIAASVVNALIILAEKATI